MVRLSRKVSHTFGYKSQTLELSTAVGSCTRARLNLEPSRLFVELRFAFFLPLQANRKARRNFHRERAHAARTRCAHGATRHVSRRAARASSGAQNGASHGVQTGASSGAQSGVSLGTRTARLPTRELASSGAQTARLYGARGVCFLNLSVWTLVWLLCDLSAWATFALNHKTFGTVFSIRRRAKGRVISGPERPNGVPSYKAPPCPASPPCAAPTRPARGVSGFWIRQVVYLEYNFLFLSPRILEAINSNVSSEARAIEILCKSKVKYNIRMTSDSRSVQRLTVG